MNVAYSGGKNFFPAENSKEIYNLYVQIFSGLRMNSFKQLPLKNTIYFQ